MKSSVVRVRSHRGVYFLLNIFDRCQDDLFGIREIASEIKMADTNHGEKKATLNLCRMKNSTATSPDSSTAYNREKPNGTKMGPYSKYFTCVVAE